MGESAVKVNSFAGQFIHQGPDSLMLCQLCAPYFVPFWVTSRERLGVWGTPLSLWKDLNPALIAGHLCLCLH